MKIMTNKKYTYLDDFFIRKKEEINEHFSKYINIGFKKCLFRGSTAKDLFIIAIKEYFKFLNIELKKELEEYKYKNEFNNSLNNYKDNILKLKQEILKYLDTKLYNFIRNKGEKDIIYTILNDEINKSIKEWYFIINKKEKKLFKKNKSLIKMVISLIINRFLHV